MITITPLFKHSLPSVTCFSTTRHGGYSQGNYADSNCNLYCGDRKEPVLRNRELLCSQLGISTKQLVIPHQTHSVHSFVVEDAFFQLDEKEQTDLLEGVDATLTNLSGVCLCISTADCVPVMLYDNRNHVIAAIHSGWRGTQKCIVSHTIDRMHEQYGTEGKDLYAAIGPSISFENFEVGDEVYQAFEDAGFPMPFISRRFVSMNGEGTQKWHIDLWQACRLQLLSRGVAADRIDVLGVCTYAQSEDYFSARRMGIDSGRILSGILLND